MEKILANTVYSDSTLKSWKKENLIELIRILEHNWQMAEQSLNVQAKNCEMLLKQKIEEIENLKSKSSFKDSWKNKFFKAQEEIKEWETLFDISNKREYRKKFNEEWKKEYQKELDKQGEGIIAGFPDFDLVYKLYFEQKKEIERLTEEANQDTVKHIDICTENFSLRRQNTEFQKQVDELKKQSLSKCDCCTARRDLGLLLYQNEQAVKDTAKELIDELINTSDTKIELVGDCDETYYVTFYAIPDYKLKELAKRKGVEVE